MTTTAPPRTTPARRSLVKALIDGAGAGVIAALVMGAFAMIVAWIQGIGFLTPLYHIGSLLTPTDSLMASMEAGMSGDPFHLAAGPALLGLVIHMVTGAGYGGLCALALSRTHLSRPVIVGAGLLYGLLVFAFSAWIALPAAAAVFSSGEQITNMAAMAGWTVFLIEHLLFGLVLGAILALRRRERQIDS